MRYIVSFLVSFLICFSLFIFMDIMITTDAKKVEKEELNLREIFVSSKKENFKNSKKKIKKVQKLPIKKLVDKQFVLKTKTPKIDINTPKLSSLESKIKVEMLALKQPSIKQEDDKPSVPVMKNIKNEEIIFKKSSYESIDSTMAIKKVEPHYPRRAKKKGISGFVTFSFKIDFNGKVFDPKITDSNPKKIFDKDALQALKKWKFTSFAKAKKYKTSSITFKFRITE